ncbi:DNA polymerase III subunit gamma/tau [Acidomonas methanolica]|nr:DNA polymerase III subunit gamma/tau [Acidomonas methanolica]
MSGRMDDTEDDHEMPLPLAEGGGFFDEAPVTPVVEAKPYRVLARKYRPTRLDDLIGQEATVRILRRAFELGRVAHAFMLTGVRGVGKTTTARIIARALNCVGVDGKGGPTADPCGVCPNCVAILADRHPDVLEMDAASRTGVDDVREIIEATRFRPMQARMKVFIIDEVHMLSRNAFNALLKTLEEPPAQVTFIFATTELRKVPVTVLSRCQRFDLRRIPQDLLARHFGRIAEQEGVRFTEDALTLIARAADGSVRDGLSLLDQAIAQGEGTESVGADLVSDMLGLADRGMVFDLFEAIMGGQPGRALEISGEAHERGADLGLLLTDLLELLHTVSRLKALPALRESRDLPESERRRGAQFADRLPVAALGRAWQILLKGVGEIESAPDRRGAAEMVLLRLCHASVLPTPDEIIREIRQGGAGGGVSDGTARGGEGALVSAHLSLPTGHSDSDDRPRAALKLVANGGMVLPDAIPQIAPLPELAPPLRAPAGETDETPVPPRSWREMVAFVKSVREPMLHGHLRHSVHLVRFAPPEVEIRVGPGAPQRLEIRLQALLERHFPGHFHITPSQAAGEPTLDEQGAEVIELRREEIRRHPLVRALLAAFPDARLGEIQDQSLDDYGLPPEALVLARSAEDDGVTRFGGGDEAPDLEFAPLDADFADESDMEADKLH